MTEKTSDRLDELRFKKTIAIQRKKKLSDYIRRVSRAIAKEKYRIEKKIQN